MSSQPQRELEVAAIAHAADAIIFADARGTMRTWNRAAVAVFGFAEHEAVGQSLNLIIPEYLRRAHWDGYHRAMDSGQTRLAGRTTTTGALHKDGHRLYVEMSFAVVRGPDGAVVGSVGVARDATRRYEEEKARHQGRSHNATTESSGGDGPTSGTGG